MNAFPFTLCLRGFIWYVFVSVFMLSSVFCVVICVFSSFTETLQQVVAEKKKIAAFLSRCDAQAMELQSRLDEKEGRGALPRPFTVYLSPVREDCTGMDSVC